MSGSPARVVEIRDLHKYYGRGKNRHHVLKGVSLHVDRGEFIAIIGTSGSGKTTLLNLIGGLDRGFEGTCTINGHDLQRMSDRKLSKLRNETMGFVFQAFNLLPHITCTENVMLPVHFSSETISEAKSRAQKLLGMVGIPEKIDDRPTELSGGQRQRVAIARALFNKPSIILCDEPTGSLDTATGRQILALFRELNEAHQITFILVTHDDAISRACDRIIRIEDGIILSDLPNEAVPPELLRADEDAAPTNEDTEDDEDGEDDEDDEDEDDDLVGAAP